MAKRLFLIAAALCGLILLAAINERSDQEIREKAASPYYCPDHIQYFPPGPEFKLSREAAAQKAFNEEQALSRQ